MHLQSGTTLVASQMKLKRKFYVRDDTVGVARDLLGKLLVVPDGHGNRVTGMIVETEAYLGIEDRAAHSYGGRRTARTQATYTLGGHAYVFFVYGMYYQLNVVTGPANHPHVVLIRAIEPVEGLEIMRERRGPMKDKNLTSGPGKLCIAFGIDKSFDNALKWYQIAANRGSPGSKNSIGIKYHNLM